jgi:thymidylate synthase
MQQYKDALNYILENGVKSEDRTGTGTLSVFAHNQMRFNLQDGFPMLTTKRLSFSFIVKEMIWLLKGCKGGIKGLQEMGVTIWDEWADKELEGKILPYGTQWRKWKVVSDDFVGNEENVFHVKNSTKDYYESIESVDGCFIDQLADLIDEIQTNPNSRRLILESWNVGKMQDFVLPPCHKTAQFYVRNGVISCHLQIRSNDFFLGNPYNVAQYALFTHILANICNLEVGELVLSITDAHLYLNHLEQAKLQLGRECRPLPKLVIKRKLENSIEGIDNLRFEDFELIGYNPHPSIKADVSV